jgi:chromosome partitioning protein
VADCIEAWAVEWRSAFPFVIVDTHPGTNPLTDGAMAAADLVVVPVVLGGRELDALTSMLEDFEAYNILLVPTMVPVSPAIRWIDRLGGLAQRYNVPVSPPISRYPQIGRRIRRAALTLEPNAGAWVSRAAMEYLKVAECVEAFCDR